MTYAQSEELIPFEELPMEVLGLPVAPFRGAFAIDLPSGEVSRIELEHWLGNTVKTVTISQTEGGGLGHVLFHHLRPLIRARYARKVLAAVCEYNSKASRDARAADAWLERATEAV